MIGSGRRFHRLAARLARFLARRILVLQLLSFGLLIAMRLVILARDRVERDGVGSRLD
jgi:hypothetical protein